jgi:ABC-type nitrate/sulfonate/bicarbonate transport system substrate-binding protein
MAGCISLGGSDGDGGDGGRGLTVGYQPFYAEAWSALVIKHAGLAEKYLPDGYSVDRWQVALQGAVIGNRMIAGKNQIGYTGDMPSITAMVNRETPISCTGIAGYSRGLQCNLGVVPEGSDITEVSQLDGETFTLTTGTCTHRFVLRLAEQEGLDFQIRDTGINTVLSSIRDGSATIGFGWEPVMYRTVNQLDEGRYLTTGAPYDLYDAAGIIMPDELLENDPEAAKQWMKAELEAKHIMATQPERTIDLVQQEEELSNYSRSALKGCLYRNVSSVDGAERMRFVTDYEGAEPAARLLKERGPAFLEQQGVIDTVPDASRFATGTLDTAASELEDEVDWEVRRADGGGSGDG